MLVSMLKSKIHRATVTDKSLHYEGSITVDSKLMEAADILPNEKVHVLNFENGSRVETYAIEGEAGSGMICLNGPAAKCGKVGDRIIILSYVTVDEREIKKLESRFVYLDENNTIKKIKKLSPLKNK